MAGAGLKPADIYGIATGETPVTVAHYLGLTPKWVDGTAVGGCSFMIHVRHAAAAIASGLCETVLITRGESGRSGVGAPAISWRRPALPASSSAPSLPREPASGGRLGRGWPPTLFTIPVLRYMRTYGPADFVLGPHPALHEDLSPQPRARRLTSW
jgi:acetyl-CoA acetyltransferase